MTETIEGIVEEIIPIENPERPGFTRINVRNGDSKNHVLNIATKKNMSYLLRSGKLAFWVGGSIPDLPNHDPKLDELYESDEVGGIAYFHPYTKQFTATETFLPLKIYQQ